MKRRYHGRHRAADAPSDIPTKPFPPIVTSTWVFEGAAVPPHIGSHIAVRCPSCEHLAWTYRNTEQGWSLLRDRIDEHHRRSHP